MFAPHFHCGWTRLIYELRVRHVWDPSNHIINSNQLSIWFKIESQQNVRIRMRGQGGPQWFLVSPLWSQKTNIRRVSHSIFLLLTAKVFYCSVSQTIGRNIFLMGRDSRFRLLLFQHFCVFFIIYFICLLCIYYQILYFIKIQ